MRQLFKRQDTGPRVAALTVARDEAAMMPRWVGYYGDQLGVENLVVVDDRSTDGSTDDLPCRVIRHDGFPEGRFEKARMNLVSRLARELLEDHDAVIFTDTDEFLLADPDRYDGLRDYLARRPDVTVAAGMGLNVVHHLDHEGPLAADQPVLGQRRFAKFAGKICKPSMKRVEAPWAKASHGIRAPYLPDRELLMVHLKFADLDLLRHTADLRHAVRVEAGLTEESAWAQSGEAITAEFRSFLNGGPDVPVFDPGQVDPATLVEERNGIWAATGARQLRVMVEGPLVQVPERYFGMV